MHLSDLLCIGTVPSQAYVMQDGTDKDQQSKRSVCYLTEECGRVEH